MIGWEEHLALFLTVYLRCRLFILSSPAIEASR